jgi:hypothetical protein
LREARIGSTTNLQAVVWLESAQIDGADLRLSRDVRFVPSWSRAHASLGILSIHGERIQMSRTQRPVALLELPLGLQAGSHTLDVQLLVEVSPQGSRSADRGPHTVGGDIQRHSWSREIEVVDGETSTVEVVNGNGELAERIVQRLSTVELTVERRGSDELLGIAILPTDGMPIGLACDVIWRVDGREWCLGTYVSGVGAAIDGDPYPEGDGRCGVYGWLREFAGSTVDLVFRPNPDLARATVDLTRVYGNEIILRSMKVVIRDRR